MTLQIGIIGTGWFSRTHADIIAKLEGAKLQAVCGTSKEKADRMAVDYGATGYASLEEMLDKERLDAAYICVPPMAHGVIEKQLIARGIPFLVEKPLGLDAETPADILAAVEERNLLTSVGYHFRYKHAVRQLKSLLAKRRLGMVSGGWMGDMPGVSWWRKQEGSGGQFIEQTTHLVDLLRYTAGEVAEVYAVYGNRIMQQKAEGVSVSDVGVVTLTLNSGVVASLTNTCVLPSGTGWFGLSFYTDEGIIEWGPNGLVLKGGEDGDVDDPGNPYVAENEAFLHAVRTGDRSGILSSYADAYQTQRVTCAALKSATSKLAVRL